MRKFAPIAVFAGLMVACGACAEPPMSTVPSGPMSPDPEPGRPVELVVHADTSCSRQDVKAMHEAADTWKAQSGLLANIRIVHDLDYSSVIGLYGHTYNGDTLLTCVPEDSPEVKFHDGDGKAPSVTLGWVYPPRGMKSPGKEPVHISMVSDRLRGNSFRKSVYLHEFGHALGLAHIESFDTVMWPSTYDGKTTCLKKPDLDQFCEVHDCGTTQTFPCE